MGTILLLSRKIISDLLSVLYTIDYAFLFNLNIPHLVVLV
jgi:hypothetical protein